MKRHPSSLCSNEHQRHFSLSMYVSSHFPYWWQKLAIQIIIQMYEVWLRKRANLIGEVELKDETSQTHQFGHTKETQALFPDKIASRQGLSYEGSSKKHKKQIPLDQM